jgi:hypothetical protein
VLKSENAIDWLGTYNATFSYAPSPYEGFISIAVLVHDSLGEAKTTFENGAAKDKAALAPVEKIADSTYATVDSTGAMVLYSRVKNVDLVVASLSRSEATAAMQRMVDRVNTLAP